MINLNQVQSLQLEISNYCNAACPQCPRNFFGGKTLHTLPLRKWSFSEFKKIIPLDELTELKQIYFCGTYGDPMTNQHIVQICEYVKQTRPEITVGIHTNGGVGKPQSYVRLAKIVDFIAFGIDGLETTNHIYRRNVQWNKLINNVQEFVGNNGIAYWDFIVFDHNQHQIEQARELSKQLGFENFTVKKTGRFLNRRHEFENHLKVYNKKDLVEYLIYPPSDNNYKNTNYLKINEIIPKYGSLENYSKNTCIECNSLNISEIYIGAEGFVFPCGWLHDRLYGPEIEGTSDQIQIKKMMNNAGGLPATNVFYGKLRQIVEGEWFRKVQESWNNNQRLSRCGIMCGKELNLIGEQNSDILYKE